MHTLWTAVIVIAAFALSAGAGAPLTAGILRWAGRRSPEPEESGSEPEESGSEQGARTTEPDASENSAAGSAAERGASEDRSGSPERPGAHPEDILRGGLWIGILERLAITGCILAAYPAGVAVVVAVKGLGRFSTLREVPTTGVSERFLVGTLASYLWAAVIAVAALGALRAIP